MYRTEGEPLLLFHTGYAEIRKPDLRRGRKNADFGQGFYLTPDRAFSERWGRERKGESVHVNMYRLDLSGLRVYRFAREKAWSDYIFRNRRGQPDALADQDVIIGPVANDTLFNTMGILSSGFLPPEEVLQLLRVGPEYIQVVIKTERAAARLTWLETAILDSGRVRQLGEALAAEERAYQEEFAGAFQAMEEETPEA